MIKIFYFLNKLAVLFGRDADAKMNQHKALMRILQWNTTQEHKDMSSIQTGNLA